MHLLHENVVNLHILRRCGTQKSCGMKKKKNEAQRGFLKFRVAAAHSGGKNETACFLSVVIRISWSSHLCSIFFDQKK